MRNSDVAKILYEIAYLLEVQDIQFKPRAYRKATQSIESMSEDIAVVWKEGKLEDIPGVGKSIAEKIDEFLTMLGLNENRDQKIGTFSKGMKQKISVTSAIMHNPKNLLLDEPVYGLHPLTSRALQDFIKNRKGTTVIATHSTQLVEQVADVVYLIMRGKVILYDKVSSLVSRYGSIEETYFQTKDGLNV